jgi:hypothetical protein
VLPFLNPYPNEKENPQASCNTATSDYRNKTTTVETSGEEK